MPTLQLQNPSMSEYQKYVGELEKERGFSEQTTIQKCLMLGEEVGELFKAVRKSENMYIDPESAISSVEEEIADVFIFLCSIANRYDIDIETAFRKKEEINKKRKWV